MDPHQVNHGVQKTPPEFSLYKSKNGSLRKAPVISWEAYDFFYFLPHEKKLVSWTWSTDDVFLGLIWIYPLSKRHIFGNLLAFIVETEV